MNRYTTTFNALKKKNEIAFIPFAVAGDPGCVTSEQIFKAYIDGGADILEIGYPFSDPVADGPVNQRASQRAIAAGLDHTAFFNLIKKIRAYNTTIPIGVLMYANSALHLGYDTFCKRAASAGIDSILIADMPPEESFEFQGCLKKYGIGSVFIVSELTPPERLAMICSHIDSFVYVVSRLGATGVDTALSESVGTTLMQLKKVTQLPCAVGFGISTPDHVRAMIDAGADAAIVGSALVATIEAKMHTTPEMLRTLKKQVAAFKMATRFKKGGRS